MSCICRVLVIPGSLAPLAPGPLGMIFSSALCYCTANLLSSRGRPSSVVRHPSVHPSVVHKTHFLRNRQAQSGSLLYLVILLAGSNRSP